MSSLFPMLGTIAWSLAGWFLVSLVAAVVVSIWFRRRARANELLAMDARRREFLEAVTSEKTTAS